MTAPASRRGFLRDLAGLPFVGGGLAIIGAPSAVAAPVTPDLLESYDAWLEYERRALQWERNRNERMIYRLHLPFVFQMYRNGQPDGEATSCDYIPAANDGARYHVVDDRPPPSTRAALVLSAVGCRWRGF